MLALFLSLAVLSSIALVVIGVFYILGLRRRRHIREFGSGTPGYDPAPQYPQYDRDNPEYRNGYQFVGGQWVLVQVFDEAAAQWFVHGADEAGSPTAWPVGIPRTVLKAPRLKPLLAGLIAVAVIAAGSIPASAFTAQQQNDAALAQTASGSGSSVNVARNIQQITANPGSGFGISWDKINKLQKRASSKDAYILTDPVTVPADYIIKQQIDDATPFMYGDSMSAKPTKGAALAARIFLDPGLTQNVAFSQQNWAPEKIQERDMLYYTSHGPFLKKMDGNASSYNPWNLKRLWGPGDTLYFERLVGKNGKKLARSVVTPFVLDTSGFLPQPTGVHTSVRNDGTLAVTWNKVKNAASYEVVLNTSVKDDIFGVNSSIIANTTSTSWNSGEGVNARGKQNTPDDISENEALASNVSMNWADGGTMLGVSIGVFAHPKKGTQKTSLMSSVDASSVINLIPNRIDDLDVRKRSSAAQVPTTINIKNILNDTVAYPVKLTGYDPASRRYNYSIPGTSLEWFFAMSTDQSSADIAEITAKLTNTSQNGVKPALVAGQAKFKNWSAGYRDIKPSTTTPKVKYPVTGFDDGVSEYIAANMIAGNKVISLGGYPNATSLIIGSKYLTAILAQNPYAIFVENYAISINSHAVEELYVQYSQPKATILKTQAALQAKAQQVVAEVITPGMSDRQKAQALNDYLVTHASYNYDALNAHFATPNATSDPEFASAWSPTGVLLDDTGVCQSFALAYTLLSQQAEVRTVTVMGTAHGSGHAWNETYMDGKWQVVDPTWNQGYHSLTATNRLFGITDAQALSDFAHIKDPDSWVPPNQVAFYAAK